MKARLLALAVAAVAAAACLLLALPEPASPPPPVRHGDFATRFQPSTPGHPTERERWAGAGSIKDLRPVPIRSR